jgi:hypothetical protein
MLRIGGAGHAPGARTYGRAEGGLCMPEQRTTGFGAHTEPRVCECARVRVSSCHHYHHQQQQQQQQQQVSLACSTASLLQLATACSVNCRLPHCAYYNCETVRFLGAKLGRSRGGNDTD